MKGSWMSGLLTQEKKGLHHVSHFNESARQWLRQDVETFDSDYLRDLLESDGTLQRIDRINILLESRLEDGTLVGILAAEQKGRDSVLLHVLFVAESFRARGYGTRLVEHFNALSERLGMRHVTAVVLNSTAFQVLSKSRRPKSLSYRILHGDLRAGDWQLLGSKGP
jgi:GNAT superfamily N-acetyltransferase